LPQAAPMPDAPPVITTVDWLLVTSGTVPNGGCARSRGLASYAGSVDDFDDGPAAGSMTWPKAIVLALACAFLAAAVTNLWNERSDDGPDPGTADVEFFDDMTSHHLQALSMARTYQERGDDSLLLHFAWEIQFGQSGDVRVMQGHIAEWGADPDAETAMAWMGMAVPQQEQPGMATDAELDAFARMSGAELDAEFTRLMILHHAGGIHMSEQAVELADTDVVQNLAAGMAKVQRGEVVDLNNWRTRNDLAPVESALL
jgi:uncharacterized protein (DUF305 family)